MRYLHIFSLTLLVFATIDHAPARAAPPASALDDASNGRADELTRKGNELALKLKWGEAEPLFRQAWGLKHSYDIGANLGIAELSLGKYRDAAEHLSFALKAFPVNGKGAHRELLQESIGKAKAQVGALVIEVNVKGAEVLVDGKGVGVAPLGEEVFVEAGARTVEAKLEGYVEARRVVEATKGGAQTVSLALEKVAPVAPPVTASAAPTVAAPPVVPVKEDPQGGMRKAILIGGAGTTGAALVAGVVLTVVANGKASAAREKAHELITATGPQACMQPSDACMEVGGLVNDRVTFSNAAAWSFVGAGALGAATVVYALATKAKPKAGVRAVPVVTANGGGFLIGGAW